MQRIENILRRASGIFAVAGCAVMLAMFLLVSANIIGRPFGESIRGTVEMSGFLCALAVGLCLPGAQYAGSHISAGLCSGRLPRAVRGADKALTSLVCLLLLGTAAAELRDLAAYARDMGEYIDGFDVSYYGMVLGLAAGLALHAAIFALELARVGGRIFAVLRIRLAGLPGFSLKYAKNADISTNGKALAGRGEPCGAEPGAEAA